MTELLIKPLEGARCRQIVHGDAISIGRALDNDVHIYDPSVSRFHARLVRSGSTFEIVDLGSRNGVLVNDQRIASSAPVIPGDRILLGDVEIELIDDTPTGKTQVSDDAFEADPASTTILSRDAVADNDLAALAERDTTSAAVRLDPKKLLALFEKVTHAVIEQRPAGELLTEFVRQSLEMVVEADRACLILVEGNELRPQAALGRNGLPADMNVSRTIVQRVLETRVSMLSRNALRDPRFSPTDSIVSAGTNSVMCAPLVVDSQARGVLYVDTLSPSKFFNADELHVLSALGNIAAAHLERQRLMDEAIWRQVSHEQVLAAARTQRRLLRIEMPQIPGYAFHTSNRPCYEVGGDYVDLVLCQRQSPRNRVFLVLGDVCGKGIDAAILMATLKAAVCAQSRTSSSALALVEGVNTLLAEHTEADKFATLFLGVLEPSTGTLEYVNAGHDAPVLLRAGENAPQRLEGTGLAVGILPDPPMSAATIEIGPGDLLVAFTDGLHEAEAPDGSDFGEDHLVDWLVAHRDLDLEVLARRLEQAVDAFSAGVTQRDDMTQLLMRRYR